MKNLQLREMNDYELLYMAHQKNEAAYQLLKDKYKPAIIYVICQKIDSKHRKYIFDDAIQEAMMALVGAVDSYRDDSGISFSTFGILCMDRKLLDIAKKIKRGTYLSISEVSLDAPIDQSFSGRLSDLVEDTHYEYRPEEYARKSFLQEELLAAADTLDENERKVYLYQRLGYNYKQLAELTNLSRKKVDNLLQKAKKKLQKELNRKENS